MKKIKCLVCDGTGKEHKYVEVECLWCRGTGRTTHDILRKAFSQARKWAVIRVAPPPPRYSHASAQELCSDMTEGMPGHGLTLSCPANTARCITLAEIWKKSIQKTNPGAAIWIYDYGQAADFIELGAIGQGDFAKALITKERCKNGNAIIVTDADTLFVKPWDHEASSDKIDLMMYRNDLTTRLTEIMIDALREMGSDSKANDLICPWCIWSRVDLTKQWLRWYELLRPRLDAEPEGTYGLNASPTMFIWNLVYDELRQEGRAELMPPEPDRAVRHVWCTPDRIAGAKGAWKENFGEEYR